MATQTSAIPGANAEAFACTLTTTDMRTRLEEWRALRRDALLEESREGLAWTALWRRSDDVRARLEAVVDAERACCPFLTFEVDESEGAIRLRTLFPPSAEGMVAAMAQAVGAAADGGVERR